jgi:hypothetical protein
MPITLNGDTGITYPVTAGGTSAVQASSSKVLQVVSVNNKQQTSTTGTSYIASTLAASITPASSSSKILVIGHTYVRTSAVGLTTVCTIYRGATDLTSGSYGLSLAYGGSTGLEIAIPFSYLDSPSTTSSTTYTIYFKRADSAGTAYCGSANTDSVITLMEIAA